MHTHTYPAQPTHTHTQTYKIIPLVCCNHNNDPVRGLIGRLPHFSPGTLCYLLDCPVNLMEFVLWRCASMIWNSAALFLISQVDLPHLKHWAGKMTPGHCTRIATKSYRERFQVNGGLFMWDGTVCVSHLIIWLPGTTLTPCFGCFGNIKNTSTLWTNTAHQQFNMKYPKDRKQLLPKKAGGNKKAIASLRYIHNGLKVVFLYHKWQIKKVYFSQEIIQGSFPFTWNISPFCLRLRQLQTALTRQFFSWKNESVVLFSTL